MTTDGRYVDCCKLPLGGSISLENPEIINQDNYFIQFSPENHLSEQSLSSILVSNYIKVIEKSLSDASLKIDDLTFFLINQNSKSILDSVLAFFFYTHRKNISYQ